MKQEMVLGIIRHALTFAGGVLVAKGLISENAMQELGGSVITLIGGIWSILQKK
jgi:hypothetical protein